MSKNKETPVTSRKPQETAELAFYELEQLVYMFRFGMIFLALKNQGPQPFEPFVQVSNNAFLEAFLLHVRQLVHFFGRPPKNGHKDNAFACHAGFSCEPVLLGGHSSSHKEIMDRMNKDLAHLSYDRLNRSAPGDKDWNYRDMQPLFERCKDFIEYVLQNELFTEKTPEHVWRFLDEIYGNVLQT